MATEQKNPGKILVIAAHPDDEVLGCGATIALRKLQGWEPHLLIMTKGLAGREKSDANKTNLQKELDKLQSETMAAAEVLGFKSVQNLDFPDNRLDTVSRMDISHAIKEHINQVKPDVIYTHHPNDYNWDHTITFEAVLMAARHNPGEVAPREIFAFEVPSSTERGFQNGGRGFLPNVYINVAKTIDRKKLAMTYYASEAKPYPHPRSIEALEYLSRKRGYEVGTEYAEAFELVRRVES